VNVKHTRSRTRRITQREQLSGGTGFIDFRDSPHERHIERLERHGGNVTSRRRRARVIYGVAPSSRERRPAGKGTRAAREIGLSAKVSVVQLRGWWYSWSSFSDRVPVQPGPATPSISSRDRDIPEQTFPRQTSFTVLHNREAGKIKQRVRSSERFLRQQHRQRIVLGRNVYKYLDKF